MKYVFICGLHRSGTTPLAKQIGQLEGCTGFENTGVHMDEGQHLQDVFPSDEVYGNVGRFGFRAEAHLTEHSALLTSANVERLRRAWERYWNPAMPIRVEKSPSSLLRTRFLQAAFPESYFVVVKRHPVAVSLGTQKWSRTPIHSLFRHWTHCHSLFESDRPHLRNVLEVSYEDWANDNSGALRVIADFIGTRAPGSISTGAVEDKNKPYLDRWRSLLVESPFRAYYLCAATESQAAFGKYGYSVMPSDLITEASHIVSGSAEAMVLYLFAEAASLAARANKGLWDSTVRWKLNSGRRKLTALARRGLRRLGVTDAWTPPSGRPS